MQQTLHWAVVVWTRHLLGLYPLKSYFDRAVNKTQWIGHCFCFNVQNLSHS